MGLSEAYGHKRVGQIREYKRMIDGLDLRPPNAGWVVGFRGVSVAQIAASQSVSAIYETRDESQVPLSC